MARQKIGARALLVTGSTIVASAAIAPQACAEYIVAAPVVIDVETGPVHVTAEFIHTDSPMRGSLYFLGAGTLSNIVDPAASTDGFDLGQFLFDNHFSTTGETVVLDGAFESGAVLHFAYRVEPLDIPAALFRTDVHVTQFAYDATTLIFGVDDVDLVYSDHDYDDIMVKLTMAAAAPAPGGLAVFGACVILGPRRRRRE